MLVALLLLGVLSAGVQEPPAPPTAPPDRTEAYLAFIEGRRFESTGDVDAAIAAYQRASRLEPSSGYALAELAQLYARQERPDEARAAATAALSADPDQADAHWVLGMLEMARSGAQGESESPDRAALLRAIDHITKVLPARAYDINVYVTLGRLYLQTDQAKEAVEPLTTAYDRDAGALEAGLLLSQALDKSDNRARAIDVIGTVLDTQPRFFRARLLQADLLERDRRWAEAAEAYGRAAEENPKATELQVRQAAALLNADLSADARELLQTLVTTRPGDLQARYLLAQAQRDLGDLDAAEQTGLALRDLAPTDSRGPVVLSQVYADRRQHDRVIDVLTPLVANRGDSSAPAVSLGLVLRLASAHLALAHYDEAIALLDQARAGRDSDVLLDAYLLQALIAARRYERAVELGEQVKDARPGDPQPVRLLAQALQGLGRTDEAIALLTARRDAHPDDAMELVALANTLSTANRHDQAIEVLASGEARFDDDVRYWFQRGAVLERAGRMAPAEEAFRKALALDAQHAPTLNYLGYMLAERGERLDEAVRLVRQALAIDPDNGSYLDSLGWAFYKQGNAAEARTHLERAASLLVRNSVIQDHLGDVLLAVNDRAGAIAAWERALAGDKESIDADEIRRKIERTRQD